MRRSFQRQRNKAAEGWEKVGKLEKENEEYEQALKEIAKADSSNKLWKYIAIQALKGD